MNLNNNLAYYCRFYSVLLLSVISGPEMLFSTENANGFVSFDLLLGHDVPVSVIEHSFFFYGPHQPAKWRKSFNIHIS